MPDNIRVQAGLSRGGTPSENLRPISDLATDSSQDITEIARKLAAHGGGAASLDLAFDLVLHEIVGEARAASGATGAAIALARDGKMVCRATTGENAPDLGVEAASGLTGTCLSTGFVQHCRDTESNPGVDTEACHLLGVRSMLLIPLADTDGVFGVLQLFSSSPNAFADQEMATLLPLAERVTESRRALSEGLSPEPKLSGVKVSMSDQSRWNDREPIVNDNVPQSDSSINKKNEVWTAVLFLLVITAAVALGIVVGWSHGRKATTTPRVPAQSNAAVPEGAQAPTKSSAPDAGIGSTSNFDPSLSIHSQAKSVDIPAGGLVVTENGKVIYRSPQERRQPSVSAPGGRELIHRVEPDYPPKARADHIEGMVILDLEIARDGSVANAAVVSGDPLLASAAVQAVRQWQYQPDPGGASRTRVTLQFTLPVH